MKPFTQLCSLAAPLGIDNVDTDQIIPSREMKTVGRSGLANGLFAGWRYLSPDDRTKDPDFVLNRPEFSKAEIIVGGENFGCGSSREHAVWALSEFGIRAIIAKSFGEIFYNNCARNGLLPVILEADTVDELLAQTEPVEIMIDLKEQTVTFGGSRHNFDINSYPKRLLIEGLDPIGLTKLDAAAINAFVERDAQSRPWLYA